MVRARQTNNTDQNVIFVLLPKINHLAMIDFASTSLCRVNSE
jgi:hypothetical protein